MIKERFYEKERPKFTSMRFQKYVKVFVIIKDFKNIFPKSKAKWRNWEFHQQVPKNRSSCPEVFCKKVLLEILQNS